MNKRGNKISDELHASISWNPRIENNVKEIGEKSKGYKIMHIKQSRKIARTYRYLTYAGICLGPLAGLLSGIGAILYPPGGPVEFPIAATCVAFISGIVVAVIKTGKYEENKSHHKLAASKYTSLESNVRRQLDLCKTDRTNAAQYLEWVGNSFDELFMASPLVAENVYNEYAVLAKGNGLIVPDEYGLTIKINKEYQDNKLSEMKNVSKICINKTPVSNSSNSEDILNTKNSNSYNYSNVKKQESKRIEETLKGDTEIKRDGVSQFPELNKFSDTRMEYEMKRMMGIK